MNFETKRIGLLLSLLLCSGIIWSQQVFVQDMCSCGVTGAGFSTGQGFGSGSFDIFIEPGSTIKKAYLFSYRVGYPPVPAFNVDGNSYVFDTSNVLMTVDIINHPSASPIKLFYKDVTNDIIPTANTYNVNIPNQFGLPINWGFWTLFLYVVYENSGLSQSSYSILINDKDIIGNEIYDVSGLNPINSNFPVGFSLYTDRTGTNVIDNSPSHLVYFNANLLGLIGGSDQNSSNWSGSSVKGHFYYQNNQLFGLNDDIPNQIMGGTDGIADVTSYIENNATSVNFQLKHINHPNHPLSHNNAKLAYFLTYTTPCQPFETTLTDEVTLCRGDSAQLLATGGQSYEWLPQTGLNCYDCPNPMFVGDSTRHYTVRIWNTDSCSKVLPVKVQVRDTPVNANLSVNAATCSEANGSMVVNNVVGGTAQYLYNIGGNNTTNPTFNNLAAGNYTLNLSDQHGCAYSQDFTIPEINPVTAAFTANPQQGTVPLNVNFTNQSTGANNFQWLVNSQVYESFNLNYTFDSAGTYPVQLIAYYNEPHCADTTQQIVIAENAFSVVIPTLHAGNLGFWSIQTTNVTYAKVQIYNAIGQLIHQTEQPVSTGTNALWPANENAVGYYFYRLKLTDVEGKEFDYKGKVLVVN